MLVKIAIHIYIYGLWVSQLALESIIKMFVRIDSYATPLLFEHFVWCFLVERVTPLMFVHYARDPLLSRRSRVHFNPRVDALGHGQRDSETLRLYYEVYGSTGKLNYS